MGSHESYTPVEVIERILFHLPIRDLLRLRRTCKAFNETINGSDLLKQKLFLAPAPPTPFQDPKCNDMLFESYSRYADKQYNTLRFDRRDSRLFDARLTNTNASYKKMFITQPPVSNPTIHWKLTVYDYEHTFTTSDDNGNPRPFPPTHKEVDITQEGGITFGDVLASYEELAQSGVDVNLLDSEIRIPIPWRDRSLAGSE